jgi:hypothetical protein
MFSRRNNFHDFLNKSQNLTEDGRYMYFIKNEMIVSKTMQNDIIKPSFLSKILRNRLTSITIWQNFLRKPEFKDRERYICVISGAETFKMVSPVFKQNIYSGVFEELLPEETPLNFFNVNNTAYPLYDKAKMIEVTVNAGGCVFVPAFYWLQTQTPASTSRAEQSTMLMSFEYECHSELVSMLFGAVDTGILED